MLVSLNVVSSFVVGNFRHWSYIKVFKSFNYNVVGNRGTEFDMTILLEGLLTLRICTYWSLVLMVWVDSKSESIICLLERKIQKRLFEIRETLTIFLGETILHMARMSSL